MCRMISIEDIDQVSRDIGRLFDSYDGSDFPAPSGDVRDCLLTILDLLRGLAE